jgi:hypothetical protein
LESYQREKAVKAEIKIVANFSQNIFSNFDENHFIFLNQKMILLEIIFHNLKSEVMK